MESIHGILRILATADAAQYQQKSKAPGELADMVSQGITRMHQLVQQHLVPPPFQSESNKESAHVATYSDSDRPAPRRVLQIQK